MLKDIQSRLCSTAQLCSAQFYIRFEVLISN